MGEEKLRKYNFVCIVIIIVSAFVEILVITTVTFSAYNDTILSDAPDIIIKAIAYTPWVLLWIAVLLKLYFTSEIKKLESRNESDKNESRIMKLESQVRQLKNQGKTGCDYGLRK